LTFAARTGVTAVIDATLTTHFSKGNLMKKLLTLASLSVAMLAGCEKPASAPAPAPAPMAAPAPAPAPAEPAKDATPMAAPADQSKDQKK
jgi:uncharacterized lipoprotein YajG